MNISKALGLGNAARDIGGAISDTAEIFYTNKTEKLRSEEARYQAALEQYAQEFQTANRGWFDTFVNGLNRLPRPLLAMGTIGLFVYAMIDPVAFSERMLGLAAVPEPMWWLFGAIVGFYFGARELHHFRANGAGRRALPGAIAQLVGKGSPDDTPKTHNAAGWKRPEEDPASPAPVEQAPQSRPERVSQSKPRKTVGWKIPESYDGSNAAIREFFDNYRRPAA